MEKLGLNRLGAALIILVVFAATSIVTLIVVAPILGNQLIAFAEKLPGYVTKLQSLALDEGTALANKYLGRWMSTLGLENQLSSGQIQKTIGDFVGQGAQWLVNALRGLVSGGAAVFSFFSLLIITPVVAFYILIDWDRMIAELDGWLPLDHRDFLRKIAREIDRALAGFIRGQSLVCLILGLWYGIGLTLIGLDFGFLIGVIAGVLGFVPYVGSLIALLLSIAVSLVQGWPSSELFFLAVAVVVAGQFLEGYVISPKLVGEIDRPSPGLADVRAPCVRPIVRLRRPRRRGAGGGGDRGDCPTSHRDLSREPLLSRPRGQRGTVTGPRQLTLDWPHPPSFARRGLSARPLEPRGVRGDRPLARLGRPDASAGRPGRIGEKPSRRVVGREGRRDRGAGLRVSATGSS